MTRSLELLLQCEPYDFANQLFIKSICNLYPMILSSERFFRERFIIFSIVTGLQCLSPLLVLIDYLEFYQDDTEEGISKHFELILDLIRNLPEISQKAAVNALFLGNPNFLSLCQNHSKANWAYFALQLFNIAQQRMLNTEEEIAEIKKQFCDVLKAEFTNH